MTDTRPTVDSELLSLVQPFDEHNRELLELTHPPSWVNPEPEGRYHLVVIGGGTAGLVSAAGAAGLGARVAMIERRLLGGDCLNYGCVPSKGIIRAARSWHEARTSSDRFGGPAAEGDGRFAAVMERMRKLRAKISHHDSAKRFSDLGVDVFLGDGRFTGPSTVEVAGRELRFRRAIVATGARPVAPPIPGLEEAGFYTNETLFTLTERPERFGVIGGGPIGCEMAQSFARLGSRVTLFDMSPHVLPREDPDAAAVVQEAMIQDGVELELDLQVAGVQRTADGVEVRWTRGGKEGSTTVDALLVAVGRAPNVAGMGLEAAGVEFDARTGVKVDDRLRTSNRRVFAVGDVASRFQFTHTADALARIAIQNALFFGRAKASDLVVPWCTYTSPEIAHVGMYEKDARERGHEVKTLTLPLAEVDRALLDDAAEGFLRVHLKEGTDKILGATVVAENAGDILGELALAVTHGVGLSKIATTIHPYPTQAEVVKKAGDTFNRGRLTPRVRKLFDIWFRIIG